MQHISDPLLQAYIDGFCNDARVGEIESHLQECPACGERLVSARAGAQHASRLLVTLDPGPIHAPSFEELEARAAARQGAAPAATGAPPVTGNAAAIADPTSRQPEPAVPSWRRPAMAWAATLVIAFGLGWISRSELGLPAGPGALTSSTFDEPDAAAPPADQETADEAGARDDLDAVDALGYVAPPNRRQVAEPEATPVAPSAAAVPGEAVPRQRVAETQPLTGPAGGLSSTAEMKTAAAPPAEQTAAAQVGAVTEPQARETNELAAAGVVTFADANAGPPPGFVEVTLDNAQQWLGVAPRQIPDLTLLRAEVGPAALADDGIAGRAVVRLVYLAPTGQQIVLLQQYTGPLDGGELAKVGESAAGPIADADAPARAERARAAEEALFRAREAEEARLRADRRGGVESDAALGDDRGLPATVREPDGRVTYRWLDAEGYVLSISGQLDPDVLRGLADLVR